MVVSCDANPSAAIADYLQRWQIETMFQALKGRGFNMEETHLKDRDKLSKLLAVLALAFCWSYKTGEYVNEEHPITIKPTVEKHKAFSGQAWITSSEFSIILKHGLMNSLRCYHSSSSPGGVGLHEKCRAQRTPV